MYTPVLFPCHFGLPGDYPDHGADARTVAAFRRPVLGCIGPLVRGLERSSRSAEAADSQPTDARQFDAACQRPPRCVNWHIQ